MLVILTLFEKESTHRYFVKFRICFESKSSNQWLLPNCEWIYKEQSLKSVLKRLDGYLTSYTLSHRQELAFPIVKSNWCYTSVIVNPIYQFIQSMLFSKFKSEKKLYMHYKTWQWNSINNQLTYMGNASAKSINYVRN